MTNRSAGAGRDGKLRELAKEGAFALHLAYCEGGVNALLPHAPPFDTCPHPDCVLVRLAVPDPLASSSEMQGELDFVRKVFARALEYRDLPCPEALIDEDGDFCFDWDVRRDATLSLSVSPSGRVGWAALVGDYKSHGTFQFPDWADECDRALSRLQIALSASSVPAHLPDPPIARIYREQRDELNRLAAATEPVRASGEPQKDYRSYHYSTPCTVAHPHAAKAYDYQCGVCGKRIASASPSDDGAAREPQKDMRLGLRKYLDRLIITGDNIGDVRRGLFVPWDCEWNGWVRDETATREVPSSPAGR